jgi:hypothetical protein
MTAGQDTVSVALDVQSLGAGMIEAARAAVTEGAPPLQDMAEMEFRRLAGALADIAMLFARGEIDQDRARTLASIHQYTVRSVLRCVEGLAVLSADQAMHAAMHAAADSINRFAGIKLIERKEKP